MKKSDKLTESQSSSAGQTRVSGVEQQEKIQPSSAGQTRVSEVEQQEKIQSSSAGQPISPISSRPLSENERSISPASISNMESFNKRYNNSIRFPSSYGSKVESPRKKERISSYGSKVESQGSGSEISYEILVSGIGHQSSSYIPNIIYII